MAIKIYKRNTAGRRNMSHILPEGVTDSLPTKSLLSSKKKKAGRSHGKISVRHQGGGHKRRFRIIDFRQDKLNIPGRVASLERDPNRSGLIALIQYADGEKRYILAPSGMKVGNVIVAGEKVAIQNGNRLPLGNIP